MTFSIAERLRPFSHQPGTFCLLPGTAYAVQVFPTLLRLFRLDGSFPELLREYHLVLKGPFKDFTVQKDLEKGVIRVWGEASCGFIRYEIEAQREEEIAFFLDKAPQGRLIMQDKEDEQSVLIHQPVDLLNLSNGLQISLPAIKHAGHERLSLGNHKSQDWDLVKRRLDLVEIFPVWHRLSQWIPSFPNRSIESGMQRLLLKCEETINHNRPDESASSWTQLFQAAFQGILVPFWHDEYFQGIVDSAFPIVDQSPLVILKQGMHLMRRHFIEQQQNVVTLLPVLPPELHCGRLLNVQLDDKGTLDLEWTKKVIRRVSLHSHSDQELVCHFKKTERCRFRKNGTEKGVWIRSGERLALEKNCHYLFDNFN
ncbi:hypothetical protein PNK_0864 [Candidatus Protochlamydia naegleriophila]|uniref:Uncharacterized protein n=1 Tax=Candidatus Protochlamydia naegleriophila TaxID=389348 RepID=A0A0U5J8V0_9BACT|nr:hypothetical protein [Candidatus Protochlamydia naegleriophila]CUI16489.1 hypothetical protein PNK_0864 [Candidatus Protochlamydia naegleriophila]